MTFPFSACPRHQLAAVLGCVLFGLVSRPPALPADDWQVVQVISAPEAHQAAVADRESVFAVTNTQIARYDRKTGTRIGRSTGKARHLNSGFLHDGIIYCAHSNYPLVPEISEVMKLDPESMQLSTAHSFGDFGGSLTWVVFHDKAWWCNFARYGDQNRETFLVKFDAEWRELKRWTYPDAVLDQLGRYSLSGGLWDRGHLVVTGHDEPVLFVLRLPDSGSRLQLVRKEVIPFTGQGIASDPVTGGLVGIRRAAREIVIATRTTAAD